VSAGIYPGGPYWRNRDNGVWRGLVFAEELGPAAEIGTVHALGEIRQRGGKRARDRLRHCVAVPQYLQNGVAAQEQ
jgi:predicted NUDIX family NTP pyrophosphohydrolase